MRFEKKYIEYAFFVSSVAIGLFIFFYKLGKIPSGFYIDEALPGYNAYSIFLTGKDEYGKFMPLVFRFYGSFNPPLYTYLTIVPISVMGLNVFSVRFLSALSGLLVAFVIYLFVSKEKFVKNKATPYFVLLLGLLSPWLILHSRVGYEVSLGLLLFISGVFLTWRGLDNNKGLILGMLLLSLSTYAAYTQRFIVPMFLVGFFVLFRKKLLMKKNKKSFFKGLLLVLFTQIPNIYLLTTPAFFPKGNLLSTDIVGFLADKGSRYLPYPVAFVLSYIREFLSQYLTYFSPRSLFYLPDPDMQRSVPELSTFYFWMVIPYLFGIYYLWKKRKENFSKLIFLLLIISPIPAAFTKDPFATHRALPHFLPTILAIGVGIDRIAAKLSAKLWLPVLSVLTVFSGILLWRSYFVFLPQERARHWMYGVEKLAQEIKQRPDTNFLIDQGRQKSLYANLAFFLKYPPQDFQRAVDRTIKENYYQSTDFSGNYRFGSVETRNINWEVDICEEKIIVGDRLAISGKQAKEHYLTSVFEIYDPQENLVFKAYKTNPTLACKNKQ